jgi:hypothetical protein
MEPSGCLWSYARNSLLVEKAQIPPEKKIAEDEAEVGGYARLGHT